MLPEFLWDESSSTIFSMKFSRYARQSSLKILKVIWCTRGLNLEKSFLAKKKSSSDQLSIKMNFRNFETQ